MCLRKKLRNLLFLPLGTKKRFLKHFRNSFSSVKCFLKSEATRLTMWLLQVMWTERGNKHDRVSLNAFFIYATLSELKTRTLSNSMSYSLTVLTIAWDTVLLFVSLKNWVSSRYATQLPSGESSSKSRITAMTSKTYLPSSSLSSSTINATFLPLKCFLSSAFSTSYTSNR